MNRRIKRTPALIGAAALCCVLVAPIAVARSGGGSGGPQATASSVQKQIKKLKRKVNNLEQQVAGLAKQPGPQGPPGAQGQQGVQGDQGLPGTPGQDATKLFAYILDDSLAVTANVAYGSGVTAVSDPAGQSAYQVTFNRSLVHCVVQAQNGFGSPRGAGNAFLGPPGAIPFVSVQTLENDTARVEFQDAGTGATVDTSFLITAFC